MNKIIINIAKDFSKYPNGRYINDHKFCAQNFRVNLLIPALEKLKYDEILTIELDGTLGYSSAWLEEAFGQFPKLHISRSFIQNHLHFVARTDFLIEEIWQYINENYQNGN